MMHQLVSMKCLALLLSYASAVSAAACALKLGDTPVCAAGLNATTPFGNINAGIDLRKIKATVIPFGDSYTSMNDSTGVYPPPPAVLIGNGTEAGGRGTNGPTWTEYIASDLGVHINPYAVGGAVTNLTLWPTAIARNISISSFVKQTDIFISQNNTYPPDSTLYIVFFGINDYTYSLTDGSSILLNAADAINTETLRLIKAGAKNILTAGIYHGGTGVPEFEQRIYNNLVTYRTKHRTNVAFVNFNDLWTGFLTNPSAYGYTNTGKCTAVDSTSVGACSTPETYVYWLQSHPSTCTHRLMADFTTYVLDNCKV